MDDMMSVFLEGIIEGELDEELGYLSTIVKTKIQITAVIDILKKSCIPAMGICM